MKLILILFCLTLSLISFGQGCSDAGFCSISGMNPTHHMDSSKTLHHNLQFGLTSGLAQFGVFITSPYVQYDVKFTEKITLSAKINYSLINGSLTSNHGFSDLFTSVNYQVNETVSIINGVKAPFNNANTKYQGKSLPMSYQTTLGTVDYLLGVTFKKNDLVFSLGTQIPMIQNNNGFFVEDLEPFGIDSNYLSTNQFIRKSDIIARINYVTSLKNEKFKLTLGLLPIYHISNDEYISKEGVQKVIDKSKGLTLNINSVIRYYLSSNQHIDVTLGIPVVNRSQRPDGLTQMALNFQYGFKF